MEADRLHRFGDGCHDFLCTLLLSINGDAFEDFLWKDTDNDPQLGGAKEGNLVWIGVSRTWCSPSAGMFRAFGSSQFPSFRHRPTSTPTIAGLSTHVAAYLPGLAGSERGNSGLDY